MPFLGRHLEQVLDLLSRGEQRDVRPGRRPSRRWPGAGARCPRAVPSDRPARATPPPPGSRGRRSARGSTCHTPGPRCAGRRRGAGYRAPPALRARCSARGPAHRPAPSAHGAEPAASGREPQPLVCAQRRGPRSRGHAGSRSPGPGTRPHAGQEDDDVEPTGQQAIGKIECLCIRTERDLAQRGRAGARRRRT